MNFDELIGKFIQPEIITTDNNCESCDDDIQYYMFFQNLETIKCKIEQILSFDRKQVDEQLKDGHDWAADHVTTAKDDIEEVADFIVNKMQR